MKETRLVKIEGCNNPLYWYAGIIGTITKVKTTNEAGKLALLEDDKFIIDEADTKTLHSFLPEDNYNQTDVIF